MVWEAIWVWSAGGCSGGGGRCTGCSWGRCSRRNDHHTVGLAGRQTGEKVNVKVGATRAETQLGLLIDALVVTITAIMPNGGRTPGTVDGRVDHGSTGIVGVSMVVTLVVRIPGVLRRRLAPVLGWDVLWTVMIRLPGLQRDDSDDFGFVKRRLIIGECTG